MYLLQDTIESIIEHLKNGFNKKPLLAYIEFWGVMQALMILHESLQELFLAITQKQLDTSDFHSWNELRRFRNKCAGHPAKSDRGNLKTRCFIGRHFGDYQCISIEQWDIHGEEDKKKKTKMKKREGEQVDKEVPIPNENITDVDLAGMIKDFAVEIKPYFKSIRKYMKKEWPCKGKPKKQRA